MKKFFCMALFVLAFATTGCNTQPKPQAASNPEQIAYKIGDTGPARGIIFYDKGNNQDGWRYLEAAPASTEFTAEWGLDDVSIKTEMKIGTGKRNTELIVAALARRGETGRAAQIVDAMRVNGFGDWFLPSWEELGLMYNNLHTRGLGGFNKDAYYWASSSFEYGDDNHLGAYNMPFMEDGGMGFARAQNNWVRAVRAF